MNCLIIDDNSKTLGVLSQTLKASGCFTGIHQAVQPYMVRSLMSWEQIDVIFLRVRLWNYRVFEKIPRDKMPVVVFLSGGKEKISEKEHTAVEYSLREPYSAEAIKKLVKQMVWEPRCTDFLFIRFEGRYHRILFDSIELVERMLGSYIRLHTGHQMFLLPGSLSSMMDRLPEDRFIRVSDTLIVPQSEVQKIKAQEYAYKGKIHKLTFRFAGQARREMESWPHGL